MNSHEPHGRESHPTTDTAEHVDIAVIGSGSGNSLPGPEFAGRSILMVDRGVGPRGSFGGTCLNVGCIPTKMFVHTADVIDSTRSASRLNVDTAPAHANFGAVRERIFGRIDPIADGGRDYRASHTDNENLTLIQGVARFVGPKLFEVTPDAAGDAPRLVRAETILLAAGSRPVIPAIPGLEETAPLTGDTVMRVESLPDSMAIIGSGVIALEFAHILDAMGVQVHLIARSGQLLRGFDEDVAARITEVSQQRYTVHLDTQVRRAERADGVVSLELEGPGGARTIEVGEVLMATGRRSNSDLVDAAAGGIGLHNDGRVRVDSYQRVLDSRGEVMDGIWAIGDISSAHQLKHVANHEMRTARHNILHPEDLQRSDTMPIPAAVFTHPQIATVGLTEAEARAWATESGTTVAVGRQDFAQIAYGWAMELDGPGDFCKILTDSATGRILGAHIIGPQAPTLIQPLIQAMSFGQSAHGLARGQYWIHPAMPELLENALLQVGEPRA